MPKIFISYRRADSRKDAGRIYDRLVEAFGKDSVFKDVDDIPIGRDFRGVLREAVAQCDVQLVIIGKSWISITDENGNRRLDNPGDFVRIEVETALQRENCRVIPVLVDSAPMPRADELPLDLRELAFKNAAQVRDDPDFHADVTRIIRSLGGEAAAKPSATTTFDVHDAISRFYAWFDVQKWDDARALLAEIRASGRAPRVFNIDALEAEIWAAIEAAERDKEYAVLRLMSRRSNPTGLWDALQVFWETYPGYDPDNFTRFKPEPPRPAEPLRKRSIDLLPAPFAWINIPAGTVTLHTEKGRIKNYIPEGQSQTFDVPAFAIAKYPVTNAQFRLFVDAGGYSERTWWTDAGWARCEKEGWTEPRYWQDDRWNGTEQPVVGVSWYEAAAFCLWLSDLTGERIMLPTEQMWQRAAQGDDGREYPWGKKWAASRCNSNVDDKGIGRTTPVRQYEGEGDSPFGVVDLAGNVWEWCLTTYETGEIALNGTGVRVLRGGSWNLNVTAFFRCAYRDWFNPNYWYNNAGFRLVLS